MKTFIIYFSIGGLWMSLIPFVHTFKHEHVTISEYQCPPYHKETRVVLEEFLKSERFEDQRQKMGLRNVTLNEISYLKSHEGCLQSGSPGPRSEDFLTTFYKSDEYYFKVNYFRLPMVEKVGENVYNFDLRSHSLMVYDKNFKGIGGVLF